MDRADLLDLLIVPLFLVASLVEFLAR